jgi:phenylacetate-coenzyme A ligase PaaK-like adenylate-forming protein
MFKIFNPFLISDFLFRTSIFKYYRILKNESTLKRQEILSIQNKKLVKVLKFVTDNIPFYQQLKIKIDNTRNDENIHYQFPIVNKRLINCDVKRFYVKRLKFKEITVLI